MVATTPILVAVARSNQPETFFVLALALTAWAATKALERRSLGWLVLAGVFIAAGFQTYMLESWAVWPALAAAYLCTRQSWPRRLAHVAIAGATSLVLSLGWIIVVTLIPASQRPYIGSTLSNSPWEMVFGYNGLGRFGSSTADGDAYRSFTPLALLIGAAFAATRRSGALWAQLALPIAAALSALGISIGLALGAGGTAYSLPAAIVQCVVAAVATALVVRERRSGRRMPVTTVLGVVALLLTPAVWSAVTIATPNSTNPVAGGVSAMGVGGARGMARMGGPGAGGAAGFGGAPGSGGAAGSSGGAGGGAGAQARGGHGTGTARGDGLPAGRNAGSATGGTGGTGAAGGLGTPRRHISERRRRNTRRDERQRRIDHDERTDPRVGARELHRRHRQLGDRPLLLRIVATRSVTGRPLSRCAAPGHPAGGSSPPCPGSPSTRTAAATRGDR
ncbi:ArnT family glycosyltransferase [Microbacterium lacticum]